MRALLVLLVLAGALAGCARPTPPATSSCDEAEPLATFDGASWPRLDGVTLTILDHGAFGAFDDAKAAFERLTGAKVEHVSADDSGGALQRAVQEKGDPTFDVVYGVDNVLWTRAVQEDVFQPYRPRLADRIEPDLVFFGMDACWRATPVDHGFVGVNVDDAHPALAGATVDDLDDVAAHAGLFVTQDPRTSTPGLGFLLATIATYGEPGWKAYWERLFDGGVLVTSGWTEAYEQHFSGGYGVDVGGKGDRPIVVSYTESPAYERFFGRPDDKLASVVLAPNATFHQVQTMGIARGAPHPLAAQAWIEFTLTDAFQSLAAPGNAVYPVARNVSVESTYGGVDPRPGSFAPAEFTAERLGADVERWVREWVELCEAADCA